MLARNWRCGGSNETILALTYFPVFLFDLSNILHRVLLNHRMMFSTCNYDKYEQAAGASGFPMKRSVNGSAKAGKK